MAKISCLVGYASGQKETKPDVFEETYEEHRMKGDLIKLYKQAAAGDLRIDDASLDNRFSLVGGSFAFANFSKIKYVEYLGQKWKVTGVEVERPRLILTVGGVWNE